MNRRTVLLTIVMVGVIATAWSYIFWRIQQKPSTLQFRITDIDVAGGVVSFNFKNGDSSSHRNISIVCLASLTDEFMTTGTVDVPFISGKAWKFLIIFLGSPIMFEDVQKLVFTIFCEGKSITITYETILSSRLFSN